MSRTLIDVKISRIDILIKDYIESSNNQIENINSQEFMTAEFAFCSNKIRMLDFNKAVDIVKQDIKIQEMKKIVERIAREQLDYSEADDIVSAETTSAWGKTCSEELSQFIQCGLMWYGKTFIESVEDKK